MQTNTRNLNISVNPMVWSFWASRATKQGLTIDTCVERELTSIAEMKPVAGLAKSLRGTLKVDAGFDYKQALYNRE